MQDLIAFLEQAHRPRILVVGDVILDRYLWGNVDRISPEAPIPLLRVAEQEHRLGGAGSVAAMLATLGAEVLLVGVVGDDAEGQLLRELLGEVGVSADGVFTAAARPTTVKQRLLGRAQSRHPQQMIRVDFEDDGPLDATLCNQLLQRARDCAADADLMLVSDYNKGVCAGDALPELIALGTEASVRVVADPVRGGDYERYRGVTCITPNRLEASQATGITIEHPGDGLRAAERILQFGIDSAVVTLDQDGIAWADARGSRRLFPVRPRQVYDITGAGDMVLSMLGYALAAGLDYPQAIELANLAGGLEVQQIGVVPIGRDELIHELLVSGTTPRAKKVVSLAGLDAQLAARRHVGQRIAMTNGCFDLMHPGHVSTLEFARAQGDCLVVGLNSDQSVRGLKGGDRPLIDEQGRAEMLAALACVDYVVLFDETSVAPLVEHVRPDVLVKAAQYGPDEVVGGGIVEDYGGRVVLAPMNADYSTTRLVDKITNLGAAPVPPDVTVHGPGTEGGQAHFSDRASFPMATPTGRKMSPSPTSERLPPDEPLR